MSIIVMIFQFVKSYWKPLAICAALFGAYIYISSINAKAANLTLQRDQLGTALAASLAREDAVKAEGQAAQEAIIQERQNNDQNQSNKVWLASQPAEDDGPVAPVLYNTFERLRPGR